MHLDVTCAVIERDGRVLCTRRSASMSLPNKWEFPGGKIREWESPGDCLRREILEELGVEAGVGQALPPVSHRYPEYGITLYPFLCTIEPTAAILLREHDRAAWVPPEELGALDWAAADVSVVKNYLSYRSRRREGSGNSTGTESPADGMP